MEPARSEVQNNPKQHINILSNFLLLAGIVSMVAILILGWHSYNLLKSVQNRGIQTTKQSGTVAVQNDKITGFITDLTNASVSLSDLYKQGPTKDSIPAINNPIFVDASSANLDSDEKGIFINTEGEQRFYPYNILVWHNILNDVLGQNDQSKYIVVSYCPITGTSAVFNRYVDGETLDFGVSGLLYESNLVMYDRKTESLWSQSLGKGIVGKFNNSTLERIDTQVMTYGDVLNNYPTAKVLSSDTGFVRDYTHNPYAEYQTTDVLYPEFKLTFLDDRYPPKKLFYVVNQGSKSIILDTSSMEENIEYRLVRNGVNIMAKKVGSEIFVEDGTCRTAACRSRSEYNPRLNGYYSMWFSWAVHHKNDGVVWEVSN